MSDVRLVWRGELGRKYVITCSGIAVNVLAEKMLEHLKVKCSLPSPPPSKPGEYPRTRSGHLLRTFMMEYDREVNEARVGSNDLVAKFLELGTRRMAPRPWLRKLVVDFVIGSISLLESTLAKVMSPAASTNLNRLIAEKASLEAL